jgi:hypothetical protein
MQRPSEPPPEPSDIALEPIEPEGSSGPFPLSIAGRALLAVLSVGTAVIHLVMVPAHAGEWLPEGLAFAASGWFALGFAVAVVARPTKRWLQVGLVANLVFIAAWAVTRFIGMPFGPQSGSKQAADLVDLTCVALEAALVIGCAVFMSRPRLGESIESRGLVIASVIPLSVLALTTGVVASPNARNHDHGGSAELATGDHVAGDHDSGSADHAATDAAGAGAETAHTASVVVPYDPTKPLDFGGVPGVSPEEQARAENLVALTLAKLPQWSDYKYDEAHGFKSIGDGLTGTEHFMNQEYMDDDVFMDPDKPESLVFDTDRKTGTKTLSAAMYMLKTGTPFDQVPDLGGALTQWHTHNNLCFTAAGKVAGLTKADGTCPTGLFLPQPTPMIHVWLRKNPCGPFAALEGIGGGTIAEGQTKLCDTAHGSH